MATLQRALEIAIEAHKGQVDKAGAPYILHPLHIMLQFKERPEQIVGVLHDVIEDTPVTLEALEAEGFSEAILAGVDAMTRRPDETYEQFIERASKNALARVVKEADLVHNMDTSRLSEITEKDRARLERYKKALAVLQQ